MKEQFKRVMDTIFDVLPYVAVYVDDIVVLSENREWNVTKVLEIIEQLKK